MKISSPCIITPRLLPGLHIGGAFVSIEYGEPNNDGRTTYVYYIDLPDFEYESNDLASGCQGGDLQDGLESLLAFLGAAAEAKNYEDRTGRKSENADLFPAEIVEWAAQNSDEIAAAQYELDMNREQDEEPYCIDEDSE